MNVAIEADLLVNGDRAKSYGSPTILYNHMAELWSAYLGIGISAEDVINLHILMKLARTARGYHRDSYVDIAGYALVAEKMHLEGGGEYDVGPEGEPVMENDPPRTRHEA